MTREIICMQTGQCGNQLGSRFWDLTLERQAIKSRQHSTDDKVCFDRAMKVMFRNVDHRTGFPLELGTSVSALKARAVLVDMENGVIDSILRSPLGELFSQPQIVTDVSGSGNNWAVGFAKYGAMHGERILEAFRYQLECCDCVDSIIFMQSLSGGTGSGLGSYIVERIADAFPKINRLVVPVFPSVTDNVVTWPYNSILSLHSLSEHANVVVAIDNDSLFRHDYHSHVALTEPSKHFKNPYDITNTVAASMIDAMTTSLRIGGDSVVYPSDIQCLTSGDRKFLSPALYMFNNTINAQKSPLSLEGAANGRYDDRCRLIRSYRTSSGISSGYFYAGDQPLGTVLKTMTRPCELLACGASATSQRSTLLHLSNCRGFHEVLYDTSYNFSRLQKRRAHLHHYLEYIEQEALKEASDSLARLLKSYALKEKTRSDVIRRHAESNTVIRR